MNLRSILFILLVFNSALSLSQKERKVLITSTETLKKAHGICSSGEFISCIKCCDSILKLKNVTSVDRYAAYEFKAGIHHKMGDIDGALKFKLKQLDWAKKIDITPFELFYAYDHLAQIYKDLNRADKAIEASKKALRSVEGSSDTSQIILASNNLGHRLLLENRNSQAIDYYKKGIKFYHEYHNKAVNDSIIYHILKGNLGYIEALHGDDVGIVKLESTLAFLDIKNFNRADTRLKLGRVYLKRKKYQKAEQYLSDALKIAYDYDQLEYQDLILFEKIILHSATNDEAKLQESTDQYNDVRRQIKLKNSSFKILGELSELKLQKFESENKALQNQIRTTKQQRKISYLFLAIGIIAVVSVLLILLVLYRKRKTESLHEKELHEIQGKLLEVKLEKETKELENITKWFEIQKKEMSVLLVSSKTREEQLVNIITELKDLKKGNSSDVNSILSDIQIKLNSITSETGEKIESPMDNLEISKFRNALTKEHPTLTVNEIDLCMMVISGMDSKKIGNVKSISPSSVRTNKSRLKKKLNLHKDDDLNSYLISLIEK